MKYANIVLIILFLVMLIGYPLFKGDVPISSNEIRSWVSMAVLYMTALTFSVLRLYNAIVNNTLHLIKLNKYLDNFTKGFGGMTEKFSKLTQALSAKITDLKNSNESINTAIAEYLTKIRNK